ncbi:hypothetical protein F3Y22_tig00110989pilonHSYRG00104 [Hibiscus syriacus]|uniref:Uncharacterized protein n=1 Tax=Hibiscus syriacus TaxID=106335 RepID=A0A6A2Z8K2_HIBSY|nr:uncharacterized protein LOC120149187 [Hibiscus syriacus]KAE8688198.1 hypothetical protein F3Y22_tig00110989pilonHSYRG00104 [Hibiscus syriacus]
MEQRKMSSSHENYSNSNSFIRDDDEGYKQGRFWACAGCPTAHGPIFGHQNLQDDPEYKDVPIHSQVMKIKREFEMIKHLSLQQSDIRREISRQRSRSPLGLAERPISVGNS